MNSARFQQSITQFIFEARKIKRNGFDTPFNILQVISWVVFVYKQCFFYIVIYDLLNSAEEVYLSCYILFSIATFIFGFLATKTDPTDPLYYEEIEARKNGISFHPEASRYCTVCGTYVQEKTKHCGSCNRCVHQFDHHCQWLNNCVGKLNYKYFMLLLFSVLGMTLTGSVACIEFFITMIEDYDQFLAQVNSAHFGYSEDSALAFIIIFFMLDPFIIPFISDIILYHAWLYRKGLSTYEHILIKRERLEEQEIEKERKKQMKEKQKKLEEKKNKKKVIQDLSRVQEQEKQMQQERQINLSQNSQQENNQLSEQYSKQNEEIQNGNSQIHEESNDVLQDKRQDDCVNASKNIDLSQNFTSNDQSNVQLNPNSYFQSNQVDLVELQEQAAAIQVKKNKLPPLINNKRQKKQSELVTAGQNIKDMSPLKVRQDEENNEKANIHTQDYIHDNSNILGSGIVNTQQMEKTENMEQTESEEGQEGKSQELLENLKEQGEDIHDFPLQQFSSDTQYQQKKQEQEMGQNLEIQKSHQNIPDQDNKEQEGDIVQEYQQSFQQEQEENNQNEDLQDQLKIQPSNQDQENQQMSQEQKGAQDSLNQQSHSEETNHIQNKIIENESIKNFEGSQDQQQQIQIEKGEGEREREEQGNQNSETNEQEQNQEEIHEMQSKEYNSEEVNVQVQINNFNSETEEIRIDSSQIEIHPIQHHKSSMNNEEEQFEQKLSIDTNDAIPTIN